MIVHVAANAGDSTAGFEWRLTREDAIAAIRPYIADGDDTLVTTVEVPDGMSPAETTDWLDSNPTLWEPAYGERGIQEEAMPEPKFYRTRITFEVLSDEPPPPDMDTSAVIHECDEGAYVMAASEQVSVELSGAEMAQALTAAGSEPGFFQLDDEGNPIEED